MMRILVVRACAIGDFVLHLPALRALAATHPTATFTLVGYPSVLELGRAFLPVEAIHSIETGIWSHLFIGPVRNLRFDAAFVWMRSPEFSRNLEQSGLRSVFRADPFPHQGHAAEHLLNTLGLKAPDLPDFWEPGSAEVLLHPGSGSRQKVWPYFRDLAEALDGATIVKGPLEADFATNRHAIELSSLIELATRLCRCRVLLGNDSGITHIAAYWGVPTVALFGPTDPAIWGPIGRRVRILAKSSLADISIEEVRMLLT
jgi:ADP-heptose:LPS heptosyltransferase